MIKFSISGIYNNNCTDLHTCWTIPSFNFMFPPGTNVEDRRCGNHPYRAHQPSSICQLGSESSVIICFFRILDENSMIYLVHCSRECHHTTSWFSHSEISHSWKRFMKMIGLNIGLIQSYQSQQVYLQVVQPFHSIFHHSSLLPIVHQEALSHGMKS